MTTSGARRDVIREARRIGGKVDGVAAYLGLLVRFVDQLPEDDDGNSPIFLQSGQFLFVEESEEEWGVWVGLAHCLAVHLDVQLPETALYDVANQLVKRSGLFLHVASA